MNLSIPENYKWYGFIKDLSNDELLDILTLGIEIKQNNNKILEENKQLSNLKSSENSITKSSCLKSSCYCESSSCISNENLKYSNENSNDLRSLSMKYPIIPEILHDDKNSNIITEINSLKSYIYNLSSSTNDVKSELSKLTSLVGGGTNRGKMAESTLISNLYKYFPDAEVNDTGYQAGKGDIIIFYKSYNIMIEVKNYEKNINRSEIEKFHRDLMQNEYHAGILISCRSGITGISTNMECECMGDKLAIYLSNAGSDGYSITWAILFVVASLKRISEDRQINKGIIVAFIKNKLSILEECINDISTLNSNLYKLKADVNRVMNSNISNITVNINKTEHRLNSIIRSSKYLLETGDIRVDTDALCLSKFSDVKPLENYDKKELKKKAEELGLKTSGNKNELLERIREKNKIL